MSPWELKQRYCKPYDKVAVDHRGYFLNPNVKTRSRASVENDGSLLLTFQMTKEKMVMLQ